MVFTDVFINHRVKQRKPILKFATCFYPKRTGYRGVRHEPGEVKLALTFWPVYVARDWRGLNTKIPVHEGWCVYDVSLRYRVCRFVYDVSLRYRICRFWELAQITAALGWSVLAVKLSGGEGQQVGAAAGLLTKIRQEVHQNIIFRGHIRSSKRVSEGIGICKKKYWGQSRQGQPWPHPV
jgi:hypothetical protein